MSSLDFKPYDELPRTPDGQHHSWDVFGRDDQAGTLNFLTDVAVVEAKSEIKTGERVRLSYPFGTFSPSLSRNRGDFDHVITRNAGGGDDRLDNYYLQESSQWDGLAHVRYREHGYFGGREVDALEVGELGIDHTGRRGVIGRGVLIDLPAHRASTGMAWSPSIHYQITVEEVEEVLVARGITVKSGDILLLRTGWAEHYVALDSVGRQALSGAMSDATLPSPGLTQGDSFARWLWDNHVAAIAADNPALEALPVAKGSGFLHRFLVPLLGMTIGELWNLGELSRTCQRLERWTFFLASVPVNLPKGVGSPNNALAIF
jgi:kynurenine formamidase